MKRQLDGVILVIVTLVGKNNMKNEKIVAIGDIHGKNIWKKIVAQEKDADHFVFIGDYFDSFDIPYKEQMDNFLEILDFKKESPDKVTLLIGNHDYQYITTTERYSGFQEAHSSEIENVITKAIINGYLKMAFQSDDWLFTHAGVTKEWIGNQKYELGLGSWEDIINRIFYEDQSRFNFTPSTALDNVGDSITQPPIWVRPRALKSNNIDGVKQVVGHTRQKNIDISGDLIFIDCLDSVDEYLIINNDVPQISRAEGITK